MPGGVAKDALFLNESRPSSGSVFESNQLSACRVVDGRLGGDDLIGVICFSSEASNDYALAHTSIHNGLLRHRNEFTFVSLNAAFEHVCELVEVTVVAVLAGGVSMLMPTGYGVCTCDVSRVCLDVRRNTTFIGFDGGS